MAAEMKKLDGQMARVEKWMRDAKINDIYEGTQQINQLIVARLDSPIHLIPALAGHLVAAGELRQHGIYYFVPGVLRGKIDMELVIGLIAPRPHLTLWYAPYARRQPRFDVNGVYAVDLGKLGDKRAIEPLRATLRTRTKQ